MNAAVIPLPADHQDYAAAREVLRCENATRAQIIDALTVLNWSRDLTDIFLVREMTKAIGPQHDLGQNAEFFAEMNAPHKSRRLESLLLVAAALAMIALAVLQ